MPFQSSRRSLSLWAAFPPCRHLSSPRRPHSRTSHQRPPSTSALRSLPRKSLVILGGFFFLLLISASLVAAEPVVQQAASRLESCGRCLVMDFPGGIGRQLPPMTPLPLARQGSVYSLTFDEFQSALGGVGKDFGSMNMDELLRNIWTAEESHAIAASAATTSSTAAADHAAVAPIQRQGSLTLPRTLSQKTVDEVWRDMMCFGAPSAAPAAAAPPPAQRQQTLGEITLEEFLVRAGVVREDMAAPPAPPQPPVLFSQSNVFAPMVPPLSLGNGLMTGAVGKGGGGPATVVSPVTSNGFGKMEGGDLSSLSPPPVPYVFNGGLRGRKASAMEKVVERRQRRMIKNRESAARSRQRKQAYTMELEAEVAKLKELNEKLQKKQVEMLEKQKNEALEGITRQIGPKSKRIRLRRTLTGPW